MCLAQNLKRASPSNIYYKKVAKRQGRLSFPWRLIFFINSPYSETREIADLLPYNDASEWFPIKRTIFIKISERKKLQYSSCFLMKLYFNINKHVPPIIWPFWCSNLGPVDRLAGFYTVDHCLQRTLNKQFYLCQITAINLEFSRISCSKEKGTYPLNLSLPFTQISHLGLLIEYTVIMNLMILHLIIFYCQ